MKKLRVGIDADGTISSSHCQIPLYNKIANKQLNHEDITDYMVEKAYGMDDMYKIIMNDPRYIKQYFDNVDVRMNATSVIRRLINNEIIEPYIITARTDEPYIRQRTESYLHRLGLDDIPLYMLSSHNKLSKAKELELDLIIDDKWETCLEMAENGILAIKMNTPYNTKFEHALIKPVNDWNKIEELIMEIWEYENKEISYDTR